MDLLLSIHKFARAPKKVILARFWDKKDCSTSCFAMAFHDVPHKAGIVYYTMSKQQYRSEMGIMGDILDVTRNGGQNGVIVSAISRKANLSHYAVLDKCDRLVNAGLMESYRTDRNRLFRVTEKGLDFVKEFQRFQFLVESMNLRY